MKLSDLTDAALTAEIAHCKRRLAANWCQAWVQAELERWLEDLAYEQLRRHNNVTERIPDHNSVRTACLRRDLYLQ